MTAPIMPERARKIVDKIAQRHGFFADEIMGGDLDDDACAARREVYASLMVNYSAGLIGTWFGRPLCVIARGAARFRKSVGADPFNPYRPMITLPRSMSRPPAAPVVERRLRPSKDSITATVADTHGVTVQALKGQDCCRAISRPRQHCMWTLAQAGYSRSEIGRHLGGRDPTTVLHGVRAHAARITAEWPEREAA
jgi:hypothetical protein